MVFIRTEEDMTPIPRWSNRGRSTGNSPRSGDRLKPLSPTRHHRSSDELRQSAEDTQSRQHLEKIDSQVTTLHTHVNVLTKEVSYDFVFLIIL